MKLRVPEDGPESIAEKVGAALDKFEEKEDNAAVEFYVQVSPRAVNMRLKDLKRLKAVMDPYRARVKRACPQNTVAVPNSALRAAAQAALFFLKPDVPTAVVTYVPLNV